MKIKNYEEFMKKYNTNYELLYNDIIAINPKLQYAKILKLLDKKDLIKLINIYGDLFTSDRELQALMLTYVQVLIDNDKKVN